MKTGGLPIRGKLQLYVESLCLGVSKGAEREGKKEKRKEMKEREGRWKGERGEGKGKRGDRREERREIN